MPLVKLSTVNVSRRRFLNLLSSLFVIFGCCSQNWPPRVANKLFNSLNIRAFERVLTFYYCANSAVMPSIHYQSRPMIWAIGGRRIRHCQSEISSKLLTNSMKIFVAVLINKDSVVAGVIVKRQSQISLMSQRLFNRTQKTAKPMMVLKKV